MGEDNSILTLEKSFSYISNKLLGLKSYLDILVT